MSNEKKNKVTWFTDDNIEKNKLIFIELDADDPRGFIHTDKTPKEVDEIIKRYIKKTNPKVYTISSKEKKNKDLK